MFSQSRGEGGEAGATGEGGEDSEAGLRGQRLPHPLDSVVQGWVRYSLNHLKIRNDVA